VNNKREETKAKKQLAKSKAQAMNDQRSGGRATNASLTDDNDEGGSEKDSFN